MADNDASPEYQIWAADNVVYGPVELPTLITWVQDGRVCADSWIYVSPKDEWQKAIRLPELQPSFPGTVHPPVAAGSNVADAHPAGDTLKPGVLRRIKILACLDDAQLARFSRYLRLHSARQWDPVVKQGDPGDGMYLVLEGELRVRILIGDKESIIATLSAGEFFGELSLFDHGPRSADVIANSDGLMLKLTAAAFQDLSAQAPDLATPFLLAICQTLAARFRADNKRLRDSIRFARAVH